MYSFQAKIGWNSLRKRENKIIVPFRSVPTRLVIEIPKKQQKNSKNQKVPLWIHFKP